VCERVELVWICFRKLGLELNYGYGKYTSEEWGV
jgi:hypothetical protein